VGSGVQVGGCRVGVIVGVWVAGGVTVFDGERVGCPCVVVGMTGVSIGTLQPAARSRNQRLARVKQ